MNKPLKTILVIALSAVLVFCFAACGGGGSEQETTASAIPDSQNTNTSDKPSAPDPSSLETEAGEDVSTNAFDAVKSAEAGSTELLSGKYAINDTKNKTYYIFGEDGSYLLRSGVYEPQGEKVILQWGSDDGWDYEVSKASDNSYYLMRNGQLIPLTFKDGFDGLTGKKLFSGAYLLGDNESSTVDWIFAKDGSVSEVASMKAEVNGDTVSIAGTEFSWKAENGIILIQTNDETIMTLVPAK